MECVHSERKPTTGGFTLVEMMIVIAIIGMMLAVGTYTLRNLTRANLREGAAGTSAAMRFAFDRALMTGAYVRLAIDLEHSRMWLEVSKDRVSLKQGREQHATDKKKGADENDDGGAVTRKPLLPFGLGGGAPGGGGDGDEAPFDVKALVKAYERTLKPVTRSKARFQKLKGPGVRMIQLKTGVFVDAVMTPRLEEPVDKGMGYVYFFPQGHAEPAIIHLRNKADEYYSVVMHPLTGQARIYNCRYRIPKEFGRDDLERRRKKSVCEDPQ